MFGITKLTGESLAAGPTTFTLERIQSQLRNDMFTIEPDSQESGIPSPFICEGLEYSFEGGVHRYTAAEQKERRELLCHELYDQVLGHELHCSRLDDRFSRIVLCNLQIENTDDISASAHHLLTRLPARPLQLPDVPSPLSPNYRIHNVPGEEDPTATATLWDDLQVTSYVSANLIRTALLSVIYRGRASHMLQNLVDTVADLLGMASTLSSSADSQFARQKWFVVRAFLWTSWQRCTMIYFYSILGEYLEQDSMMTMALL